MKDHSLLKQPSAWIPFGMSFLALALLLGYVTIFGTTRHEEEDAPARLFQLIMAAQLPVIAYFAIKWLPKRPKGSLLILALHALAWILPILAVIWLESLSF